MRLKAEGSSTNPEENLRDLPTALLYYEAGGSFPHLRVHSHSKQIWNHYNSWQLVDSVEKPHLLTGQTVLKPSDFCKSRLLTVWL